MRRPSAIVLLFSAGSAISAASADVVVQPVAVSDISTWRSCVPPENILNGSGLSNAASVVNGAPIPTTWPSHATGGCGNMYHSSCVGQPNGTECEGGDLTPFLVFDLGAEYDISGFRLWNHNQVAPGGPSETDRGPRFVNVQVSTDGVSYSSNIPFEFARAPGSTAYTGDSYSLPAAAVRFVRFNVTQNWGSGAATGLSELRFIGTRFGIFSTAASPSQIDLCETTPVLITANAQPAGNSTGFTVTANLSALGGPVSAVMNDSGIGGDVTAGDGIYSVQSSVPGNTGQGTLFIPITVSDNQDRSQTVDASIEIGACIPTFVEQGDSGELPESAQIAAGSGTLARIRGSLLPGDSDVFRINVCDGSLFVASTLGTPFDTQLFLFDANGVGVQHNDDSPNGGTTSLLSLSTPPGEYLIAVTAYNRDPVDASAQLLWNNTPFNALRAPDGPGAANPFAAWVGTTAISANYTIELTGACYVDTTPPCPADLGTTGGTAGQDGILDNNDFIVFIDYFFNSNPLADRGVTGGVPGSDGLFNNNDFIVFIDQFFSECGA